MPRQLPHADRDLGPQKRHHHADNDRHEYQLGALTAGLDKLGQHQGEDQPVAEPLVGPHGPHPNRRVHIDLTALYLRQRFDQLLSTGEALVGRFGQAFVDGRGEGGRKVRPKAGDRHHRLTDMRDHYRLGTLTVEGQPPRDREVTHHAERVEIGAPVDFVARSLFRTHEMGRADRLAHLGESRGRHRPGNAEVHHQGSAGRTLQQHVVRLDVPVHHPATVGV